MKSYSDSALGSQYEALKKAGNIDVVGRQTRERPYSQGLVALAALAPTFDQEDLSLAFDILVGELKRRV